MNDKCYEREDRCNDCPADFSDKQCYRFEKENANSGYPLLADVGERLLPCPFCGHEKTVIISADTVCYVACEKKHCQTEGPTKTTSEDAINAWNKRANVS